MTSAQARPHSIEILESRIAPATLVSPTSVTFKTTNGDLITVTISAPLFTEANVNKVFVFDTGSVSGDNTVAQQLQTLNVTKLGSAAHGINLTISGGEGQDAVGFINSSLIDLGDVRVEGDLGRISAGDFTLSSPALHSLTVDTLGAKQERKAADRESDHTQDQREQTHDAEVKRDRADPSLPGPGLHHCPPKEKAMTNADPFSASVIPFEVPEQMRAFAEKGVSQARDNYAKFKTAAESHNESVETFFAAASKGVSDYSAKLVEFMKANTTANLDFAQHLFGLKSPTEAMELWTSHARKQIETFTAQAKELGELGQKVALETAEPLKAGATKLFKPAA